MPYAKDLTQLIGNTPLVRINKINSGPGNVFAKLEMFNPFSVKDRAALSMLNAAEQSGTLRPKGTIIEATSGNTGIALAFLAAVKDYQIILVMPENMSPERVQLLHALGARVELTPAAQGMQGSIARAEQLLLEIPHSYMPRQFENPANPSAHTQTGQEIWQDLDKQVDCFVAGVGTGGTISGAGRFLKEQNPHIQIVAVEPADSAVLSGQAAGPHKIQGIGAGFIPHILDRKIIDRIFPVTNDQALHTSRLLARQEGIFAGISSGAAMYAALQLAEQPEYADKNIVVMLPDSAERYLSTELFAS